MRAPKQTGSPRPREDAEVGETPLAQAFFRGRYAEIIESSFDHGRSSDAVDVAFVVGALAFVGRVDDADAHWADLRRRHRRALDPRTVSAARFFLGVARARSGDFERSWALLVEGARERLRSADPWTAAFVAQGLACHRYFTGRYRAAAEHALRALRSAHAAGFAYVEMLSTDLRGHALVQLGRLHAGTALLERAKDHAKRVGLGKNAFAIDCSIAIYRAKSKTGADALSSLEALLARRSHDSYSRRALLTQATIQLAIRGRASDAVRSLEQADRDALRADVRRAKVTSLLARLYLQRFQRGPNACAYLLEEIDLLTDARDVAFRAELLAFSLQVARASNDAERTVAARDALALFRAQAEHHLADQALRPYAPERASAFAEDEITPLLRAASEHDVRVLPRLLGQGLLGLVPEVLGLTPARRVILIAAENTVVIEDHGDLFIRPGPPRWAPPLLRALAGKGASKEEIVTLLWGLRRYHPAKHDPLVRTIIHRLRALLDPRSEWVSVTADGYRLDAEAHGVGMDVDEAEGNHPIEDGEMIGIADEPPRDPSPNAKSSRSERVHPSRAALARMVANVPASIDQTIVEALRGVPAASVPQIAAATGASASTVLRALRRLVAQKKVEARGAARASRYRVRK